MKIIILSIISILVHLTNQITCDLNSLIYLDQFVLSKQNDLNETFTLIQQNITVPDIVYTPRIGKTYTITGLNLTFYFLDSKQTTRFSRMNQLQVSGGSLRINYKFNWTKKQLGSSINGTAEGVVISDPIGFFKKLRINPDTSQPQWMLLTYTNITFSNNFPVSKVFPFSQNDSDTLFIMMNKALDHPPGKLIISDSINKLYPDNLQYAIKTDSDNIQVNQTLVYSYFDYRGQFKVTFDNYIHYIALQTIGLTMAFSQTIKQYDQFQCGTPIPNQPQDANYFGGHQAYISTSILKSTVKYALKNNFFNILLSQQSWQSRAFQFFIGDLYLAIPSLKTMDALTPLNGVCSATDDQFFNFSRSSYSQYKVDMKFNCVLKKDDTIIVDFSILTTNYIQVTLLSKSLEFRIDKIKGKPQFKQLPSYKIENLAYAQFLVSQTLKVAQGSMVLGTGYPTSIRLYPNLQVKEDYLFLYDSSLKPHSKRQI